MVWQKVKNGNYYMNHDTDREYISGPTDLNDRPVNERVKT